MSLQAFALLSLMVGTQAAAAWDDRWPTRIRIQAPGIDGDFCRISHDKHIELCQANDVREIDDKPHIPWFIPKSDRKTSGYFGKTRFHHDVPYYIFSGQHTITNEGRNRNFPASWFDNSPYLYFHRSPGSYEAPGSREVYGGRWYIDCVSGVVSNAYRVKYYRSQQVQRMHNRNDVIHPPVGSAPANTVMSAYLDGYVKPDPVYAGTFVYCEHAAEEQNIQLTVSPAQPLTEATKRELKNPGVITRAEIQKIMCKAFLKIKIDSKEWERGVHCFTKEYMVVSSSAIEEIYQKHMKTKRLTYTKGSFVCGDFAVVFHAVVKEEQLSNNSHFPFAVAEAWTNDHVLNLIITREKDVMVFEPQSGRFVRLAEYSRKIYWAKF